MKALINFSLFFSFAAFSFCTFAETEASFKNLMEDLDHAYFYHDTERLKLYLPIDKSESNSAQRESLLTTTSEWLNYIEALVHYRLSLINLEQGAEETADQHLDSALALISIDNQDKVRAEFAALRSSLLGMKIGINFFRGMSIGSEADKALAFSLSHSKNNSHVLLFQGINLFNKPSMFGGDRNRAINVFKSAIDSFEPDAAPYWGLHDMHAWYIRALLDANQSSQAIAYFDKLLIQYPDSAIIRSLAIRIEKAIAKNSKK